MSGKPEESMCLLNQAILTCADPAVLPLVASGLAVFFLVLYAATWILCLLGWHVARTRYAHPPSPPSVPSGSDADDKSSSTSRRPPLQSSSVPGVTIIRPLCGLEHNLVTVIESTMRLNYPKNKYEVIFAVQDEADPSLDVVRMVLARFPDVQARIVIDDAKVGVNPKINNLITPFSQASNDLLWVIDSTISVLPDSLARAVETFTGVPIFSSGEAPSWVTAASDLESTPLISDDVREPPRAGDIGLVHHVPYAVVYQKTWGSLIEQAFLNTTHAKMYLAINALALDSCVLGKSNMYSRTSIASLSTPSVTLQRLANPPTGLPAFSPYLAEDNMIALALWHQLHLRHAMNCDVALDYLGVLSVSDYVARRIRWIRVRKRMTPLLVVILEPFTEMLFGGLCAMWALHRLLGISYGTLGAVFVAHCALWLLVDLSVRDSLATTVRADLPPASTGQFVLAWAAREALTLPVWLYGITSSVVVWRGKRYRIVGNGEAVQLDAAHS